MDKYIFGFKAERLDGNINGDFVEYTQTLGGNYNPYNNAYFDKPENRTVCKDTGRITSIPSPYARMHITALAFKEANCGAQSGEIAAALSADYNKALSHCLDIFEMLYYSDSIDFNEKEITIEKVDLVSTHSTDPDVQALLNDKENSKLKAYVSTLDLFRDEYVRVIKSKNVIAYKFDFTSLYLFKHQGKVFASTSPFTGFYAKDDCDLTHMFINDKKILSSDPKTYRTLAQRDESFREFMYSLLKDTGLKNIFEDLYLNVELSLSSDVRNIIDNGPSFHENDAYLKFNPGDNSLQKLNDQLFIRPDGFDCSYLKYLLYLANTVDLGIKPEEYKIPLQERRFYDVLTPWYGVNDILADSLFVLTYDINDNYVTVPYIDEPRDNAERNRCLLPIKRDALNYFSIKDLCDNLQIVKKEHNKYVVTLTIQLANGGKTKLRREYNATDVNYPNGKVIQGDDMKPFAFGIYPFVKSSSIVNMYKVLFYNKFSEDYTLKFYKKDNNNTIVPLLSTETKSNKTNSVNNREISVNCEYHDIKVKGGIEFAEIEVGGYTSLIVPKLRVIGNQENGADIAELPYAVNVAIDLGTSNTYVAYNAVPIAGTSIQVTDINEIKTQHGTGNGQWNELTFMNKKCERTELPTIPDKNREDLYLRVSDHADPIDTWLSAQLNEFIPSSIKPNGDSYNFPIPTVLNFLRVNCERKINVQNSSPLIDCSIPFAYYERGVRYGEQPNLYDLIFDGSGFKWYMTKDDFGNVKTNDVYKAAFKAFLSELMFIVRSHLVCCGYNLKECRLIWSYPLSFSALLKSEYDVAWKEAFREYINDDNQTIGQNVMYTNESRTPIYACLNNPSAVDNLTILLDIGGGSTDVIGYKHRNVQFVTSFGFAGNALYLASSMNSSGNSLNMNDTLLKKYIDRMPLFRATHDEPIHEENDVKVMGERKISSEDSISTIMNYGFAKARTDFENIFKHNDPAQYMLQLHNAAIIYQVAQMCKISSPDELPHTIYLSGNGSKQFELNTDRNRMIKAIFGYVYGVSDEIANQIKIEQNPNPKAATVNGALLGISQGSLATNAQSTTDQVVMLGDDSTICEITQQTGGVAIVDDRENYKNAVKSNVVNFLEMFYDKIYTRVNPAMKLDDVKSIVDSLRNSSQLNLPEDGIISDSFFFQYIALVMEQISLELAKNVK